MLLKFQVHRLATVTVTDIQNSQTKAPWLYLVCIWIYLLLTMDLVLGENGTIAMTTRWIGNFCHGPISFPKWIFFPAYFRAGNSPNKKYPWGSPVTKLKVLGPILSGELLINNYLKRTWHLSVVHGLLHPTHAIQVTPTDISHSTIKANAIQVSTSPVQTDAINSYLSKEWLR